MANFLSAVGRSSLRETGNQLVRQAVGIQESRTQGIREAIGTGIDLESLKIRKDTALREQTVFENEQEELRVKKERDAQIKDLDEALGAVFPLQPKSKEMAKQQFKAFGLAKDNDLGTTIVTVGDLKKGLEIFKENIAIRKQVVDSSYSELDVALKRMRTEFTQIQTEKPDDKRLDPLSKQIEALVKVREGELNKKQEVDEEIRKQLAKGADRPDEAKAFKRISTLRTGIARLESALETGGDTALGALIENDPTLAALLSGGEPPESVQDAIDQLKNEIEFQKQFLSEGTLKKYFSEETVEGESKFLGIDDNTGKEVWSIPGDEENVELR